MEYTRLFESVVCDEDVRLFESVICVQDARLFESVICDADARLFESVVFAPDRRLPPGSKVPPTVEPQQPNYEKNDELQVHLLHCCIWKGALN